MQALSRKPHFFLLILFTMSACAPTKNSSSGGISGTSATLGVYNASVTNPETDLIAHSTVRIAGKKLDGYSFTCTGSVLSQQVILTAGHCVTEEKSQGEFTLPATSIRILDQKREIVAERVIVNPGFLRELTEARANFRTDFNYTGYDIALVKLQEPLSDFYRPVQLTNDLQRAFSAKVSVAGFGVFDAKDGSKVDRKLRHGPVILDPIKKAHYQASQESPGGVEIFPTNSEFSRFLQMQKKKSTASICPGDSGGPLYYESAGKIYQIGVNVEVRLDKGMGHLCAVSETETQLATFVGGPHQKFVAEAFRELTGAEPAGFPAKEFRIFTAENFLDLDKSVVLYEPQRGLSQEYRIVPNSESVCQQSALQGLRLKLLKTASAESLLKRQENGRIKSIYEATARKKEKSLDLTVLTPMGYVQVQLPVVKCP